MKYVIRRCVWETNSSTSHATVIMTEEQSNLWESLKLYYYYKGWWDSFKNVAEDDKPQDKCFYREDEVIKFLSILGYNYKEEEWEDYEPEDRIVQFIRDCDCGFLSYEMWMNSDEDEMDSTSYTTPGGEDIVVYCKYGRDG